MNRLLICGGDMRYVHLAEIFADENSDVTVCGFNSDINFSRKIKRETNLNEAVQKADIIILPLPASHDKITVNTPLYDGCLYLKDILNSCRPDSLICLGKFDLPGAMGKCRAVIDYSSREDFASLNAVPTCEGAIFAAMECMDTTVFSSEVLVCGFGRCAKVLALTLKAMGANVCVGARSIKDLSLASALGFKTVRLSELEKSIGEYDIIFNTVAYPIFDENLLSSMKSRCVLADVASAPGGADKDVCRNLDVRYLFLPGIPGKYSPRTAAQIIKKTVNNIIEENRKDAY